VHSSIPTPQTPSFTNILLAIPGAILDPVAAWRRVISASPARLGIVERLAGTRDPGMRSDEVMGRNSKRQRHLRGETQSDNYQRNMLRKWTRNGFLLVYGEEWKLTCLPESLPHGLHVCVWCLIDLIGLLRRTISSRFHGINEWHLQKITNYQLSRLFRFSISHCCFFPAIFSVYNYL
jgi:hypothetical protein